MTSTTTPPTAADARAGLGRLRIALGVLCLILGVIVVAWPTVTLIVVALLFGVQLIVAGGVRMALATTETVSRGRRIFAVLMGVLTVAAGVICLIHPGTSLVVLIAVVAAGWFIDGVSEVVSGLRRNRSFGQRVGLIVFGVISIVGALVLFSFPGHSLILFARIGGYVLIVFAIVTLLSAVMERRLRAADATPATA